MFKRKAVFSLIVFIPLSALVLGGCNAASVNEENGNSDIEAQNSGEIDNDTEEADASELAESENEEEITGDPSQTEEDNLEETSKDGGTIVLALVGEPDTLDIYQSSNGMSSLVSAYFGGALLSMNTDGEYIPYLAESYEISDDGLEWVFNLRDDVLFHNGDPLTAHDFVWTWNRCLSDDFVCAASATMLESVSSLEAVDDYIFKITLSEPSFPFFMSMTADDYLQPLSQRAVEEAGDSYGWDTVVGVGEFMFSEWVQDEKIVLERNPDYTWGPEITESGNTGPSHFDKVEFRFLPDYATVLASLEAGEVSISSIDSKDINVIEQTEDFTIMSGMSNGTYYIQFNMLDPLFDDIRVRQALNLATNSAAITKIVLDSGGEEVNGPLSPAMTGYWEGQEEYGYPFDLEAAKKLMIDAGFTYGEDGMLYDENGEMLTILMHGSTDTSDTKIGELIVDQWKSLGINVELEFLEWGILMPQLFGGDYRAAIFSIAYEDADALYFQYHSSQIGQVNFAYFDDEEMDRLLGLTRTETDPQNRKDAVAEAVKYIIDQALSVPIYVPNVNWVIDINLNDVIHSTELGGIVLRNAWFSSEE